MDYKIIYTVYKIDYKLYKIDKRSTILFPNKYRLLIMDVEYFLKITITPIRVLLSDVYYYLLSGDCIS